MTKKTIVKCPKCDNTFFTKKTKDTQCRDCGTRFPVGKNKVKV